MSSHNGVVLMGLVVGNVVVRAIGLFAVVYFAIRLAMRDEGRVPLNRFNPEERARSLVGQ